MAATAHHNYSPKTAENEAKDSCWEQQRNSKKRGRRFLFAEWREAAGERKVGGKEKEERERAEHRRGGAVGMG